MSEENRERIVELETRIQELVEQHNQLQESVARHTDVIDGSGSFTVDDLYQRVDALEEVIEE